MKTTPKRDDDEDLIKDKELYNQIFDSTYDSDSDDNHIAAIWSGTGSKLQPLIAKTIWKDLFIFTDRFW